MCMPQRCAGHLLVPPAFEDRLDPSVCCYSVNANVMLMMMALLTRRSTVSTIIWRGEAAAIILEERGIKMEITSRVCISKVGVCVS